MKRLLAWLAGTLLLLVLAAGGLLLAGLDSKPLVSRGETISPQSVAEARWLLYTNDPRRMQPGEARRAAIPAALIDDGINYLATRFMGGRGALLLTSDHAEIHLTRRLALPAGERFLNINATIRETEGQPHLASALIGTLPVPPRLVELCLELGIRLAGRDREWQLARQAIRELRFEPDRRRVVVAYVWEPALLAGARSIAINPDELARMRSAHEILVGLVDHLSAGSRVALPTLLGPMLDIGGSDQMANRRAAIFVLAAYLSERNLASFIPEARSWPKARQVWPTLLGRIDSAQHFVISAALAAWAGEPIADAIGVYKELADALHGSGFSFADLAADRSGSLFGDVLINHPARLDRLLQQPFGDNDLIPALNELPEALGERDFQRRFIRQGSPAYQQTIREIERRLAGLPLYKGLEK